eukprot:scaffold75392_cov43-Attheya_sp.AAC.2
MSGVQASQVVSNEDQIITPNPFLGDQQLPDQVVSGLKEDHCRQPLTTRMSGLSWGTGFIHFTTVRTSSGTAVSRLAQLVLYED